MPRPLDHIDIHDLVVRTIIGVLERERTSRQDVILNVTLYTDVSRAAASDRIEDTLDYRGFTKRVIAFVEDSSFHLVEALAESVANIGLEEFGATMVTVRVEKPGALRFARSVGVTVTRTQGK